MVSAMMSCHVLDAITASRQHCSRLAVSWSLTAVGRTQSSVLERRVTNANSINTNDAREAADETLSGNIVTNDVERHVAY